jgi:AcrR family transcriptional regulator
MTAEGRRDAILAAASELFARQGYEATSTRQIAAAAGITTPVIYDHFGSKRALHVELLERSARGLVDAALLTPAADTPEAFTRLTFERFFAFVEEHPYAWRMLFRDAPADPEIAAAHRRVLDEASAAIAGLYAQVGSLDLSSPDMPRERTNALLAQLTRSAIDGLAAWWWDNREVPREQLVALAMDVLWRGVGTLMGRA